MITIDAQKAASRQADEVKRIANESARQHAKADAFVQQFVNMTPAQVVAYVNSSVANIADAKQLLTKLALMMLSIAKEQYK